MKTASRSFLFFLPCGMHDFRRLDVWKRARIFGGDIYRFTAAVRRGEDKTASTQLRKCSLGIAAAICEGCGKRTRAETLRYLDIAHGSATEAEGHLLQIIEIDLLPARQCYKYIDEAVQIQRMLQSLMRNLPPDPIDP